ncbi:unnamed protein product [Effrenium voratum]|nr:unnamed protein product [Effrenium voratum]
MPGVVTVLQKPLKAFEALEADCHFGYWAQILGQYSGFVEVDYFPTDAERCQPVTPLTNTTQVTCERKEDASGKKRGTGSSSKAPFLQQQ